MSICILDSNCVLIAVAVLERYSDGILFSTILFPESGAEVTLFIGWDDGPVNGICIVVFALEISYIAESVKCNLTIFIIVIFVTITNTTCTSLVKNTSRSILPNAPKVAIAEL